MARTTREERIEALQKRKAKLLEEISELEAQVKKLEEPQFSNQDVITMMRKQGIDPWTAAKMLGIQL